MLMSMSKKSNLVNIIGLILALIHVLLFVFFVGYMHLIVRDGQAQLLWIIFLVIDFPISLSVLVAYDLLPQGSELANMARYSTPYIVHGIIGPIWWYLLPQIISYLFRKIVNNQ